MTLKEHISSKSVASAQAAFDLLRSEYELVASGPLSSQRVVRQAQLRQDLELAAEALEKAKAQQAEIVAKEREEKREKALEALVATEGELAAACTDAEKAMDLLEPALNRVIELGKARYGHRATLDGKAQHGLLPGPAVVGWVQHRLQALGSYELGRAPKHHRGTLADLLGLSTTHTPETDEVNP